MRVYEIILQARQRLGDVRTPYRWSDEELIDAVNSALSGITTELNPFTAEWIVTLENAKSRYELPPYFHRLINIDIDGKRVKSENIRGFEWVVQNMDDYDEREFVVSVDLHHLHIFPAERINEARAALERQIESETNYTVRHALMAQRDAIPKQTATVTYYTEEQIAYKEDEINLPDRFRDAILFYALHMLHQSPVRADGENKTLYYLNLYEKQIEKLKGMVYANKHSRRIRSPHIKV